MKTEPQPPVIIIGMHRSGTTMVVELLEKLGLFIGKRRERNQEAVLFQRLNDWIFGQGGATWDNPKQIGNLLSYNDLRCRVSDYLRYYAGSPRAISYLGTCRYLRYQSLLQLPFAWGWKDPRSTFTLPLWLELFPQARVLHIYRHGVDVAMSLRHRERSILQAKNSRKSFHDILYTLQPGRANFTTSARCSTLEGGFDLWEEHMAAAQAARKLRPLAYLELKYEEMLAQPEALLRRAAEFCGLTTEDTTIAALVASIRADRAYAFAADEEATAFARGVASRLAPFGYSENGNERPSS